MLSLVVRLTDNIVVGPKKGPGYIVIVLKSGQYVLWRSISAILSPPPVMHIIKYPMSWGCNNDVVQDTRYD